MIASQSHILTQEEGQKVKDYDKMWLLCLLPGTKGAEMADRAIVQG